MPPNTKYAIIGYGVACLNAYFLSHIFRTLGLGANGGVLSLLVMALTLMSWFFWMSKSGRYDYYKINTKGELQ